MTKHLAAVTDYEPAIPQIWRNLLGMTNIPSTTTTVLVFTQDGYLEFMTDSLTLAERDFLEGGSTHHWEYAPTSHIWRDPMRPDDTVNAALMLNFRFLDEASRIRCRSGESFEMYRDNVA